MRIGMLAVGAALAMAPALAQADTLELVCRGVSNYTTRSMGTVQTNIDNGWGGNRSATVTTTGRGESGGTIGVRIHDGTWGEIKVPRELVPLWRSSSEDGWRPFSKLEVGASEIRAEFKLNAINRPGIIINRKSGDIELTGWGGGFRGVCEQAPDEDAPNRF